MKSYIYIDINVKYCILKQRQVNKIFDSQNIYVINNQII